MNPKVNYTFVGLFVLLFGAAFIAWVFWLAVGTNKTSYTTYVAYMYQSVSGLNNKASVKYRGVEVGKVSLIKLDRENPERVKLLLKIEEDVPIKEDSIAVLATQGITGLGYIELSGGSKDAALLRAQDEHSFPEIKTGPSLFVRLDTALTDLFTEFKTISKGINGVSQAVKSLLSYKNQQSISRSLNNFEQLSGTLNMHINKLGSHINLAEEFLDNTATMSKELPGIVKNAADSVKEVQKILTTVSKTATSLDAAVIGTQQEVSRSATNSLMQMSQLFEELQRTTQGLNRILQDFERNPNMFIFGRQSEKAGPGEQQR